MNWENLLTDLGYAGFAGFVVGFAVKKLINLFLMFVGLYLLSPSFGFGAKELLT
jgi:uncharacterized membrane protein (Fun14 family)